MAVDPVQAQQPVGMPTEALAQARAKRAHLHEVIVALEEAIAAPAPRPAWAQHVHDALVELGAAFERHIAVVEGPEGLFEEVTHAAPRLANALDRLRSEHQGIRGAIVSALDAVRLTSGTSPATDDGREAVLGVLDRLMRHRQHGADVVYDAYAVDIGAGD
jgi:hypothetical protein